MLNLTEVNDADIDIVTYIHVPGPGTRTDVTKSSKALSLACHVINAPKRMFVLFRFISVNEWLTRS